VATRTITVLLRTLIDHRSNRWYHQLWNRNWTA